MLVSVILNCLNGEKFLKRSIESVLNQSIEIFEIVFIDNGSSDLSAKIAKAYGSKISYFRNETTTTLGQARNQGIINSKGDLIAFIDADDEWKSDKIEKQIKLFKKGASFVFSNAEISFGKAKGFVLFDHSPPEIGNVFNSLLEKDFISTSSVMFKKDLYINSKQKYNVSLTIECDRDLFIRLARVTDYDFIQEALVIRYLHNSSSSSSLNNDSINELFFLEESINNFCNNLNISDLPSLDIFNSKLDLEKGRHYLQIGDLKNARLSFIKSSSNKGNLLLFITYIYPFKNNLKFLILLSRYLKYLTNFLIRKNLL